MKLYVDIDGVFLDYESGVVAESGENLWNISPRSLTATYLFSN